VPLGLVTDKVYGGGAVPGVEVEVGVDVDIKVLRLARTSASLFRWCRKESDGGNIVKVRLVLSVGADMNRVKRRAAGFPGI
jgi:hypothetical protein